MNRWLTPEQIAYCKASDESNYTLSVEFGVTPTIIDRARRDFVPKSANVDPLPECSEWRDIPGYERRYQVTRDGRVRNALTGKVRQQTVSDWGYLRVALPYEDRPGAYTMPVHRAVALAYVPNPAGKPDVHHLDHDKKNNVDTNLEWVTPKENAEAAVAAGAYKGRKLRSYNTK